MYMFNHFNVAHHIVDLLISFHLMVRMICQTLILSELEWLKEVIWVLSLMYDISITVKR